MKSNEQGETQQPSLAALSAESSGSFTYYLPSRRAVPLAPVRALWRSPQIKRLARMHELLNVGWSYTSESLDECTDRYSRFGSELYHRMADTLPECFGALRYFRADDHQTDDSFAICEIAHPFGIQLDPDCEVICLWDSQTHIEIGTWSADPYAEAFDFIRLHFLVASAQPPPQEKKANKTAHPTAGNVSI